MRWERAAAMLSLAAIALCALIVSAFEDVAWAEQVGLVAVGALAGVIYPSAVSAVRGSETTASTDGG